MNARKTLTDDQRWLLWTVGANITRALISDGGLQRFMQSMNGHYGKARDGAPEWMNSYQTQSGRISSPSYGEPRCVITAANIKAFRKTIPSELITELAAIDQAEMDETLRTWLWCRCHWATGRKRAHTDYMGRENYHPTKAEDDRHLQVMWDLQDRERDCLRAILGIDTEKLGQLELFAMPAA